MRILLGAVAGVIVERKEKYHIIKSIHIKIDKKAYRAARLAFLYMKGKFPDGIIMHIDGDGLNNKFDNLVLSNFSEISMNKLVCSRSSTGVNGVCFDVRSTKYVSRITIKGKTIYIGSFENLSDAIDARKSAEKKYGLYQADKEIMPDFAR